MGWGWESGRQAYREENMHKIQDRQKSLLNVHYVATMFISLSHLFLIAILSISYEETGL